MKKIRWFSALKGGIVIIYFLSMAILTFLLYTGLAIQRKFLTAQTLFTTMALYSNIKHSLCGHFGLQVSYSLQGRAALKRIQNFLTLTEKEVQLSQGDPTFCYTNNIEDEGYPLILSQETHLGHFSWFYNKKPLHLEKLVTNSMFNNTLITQQKQDYTTFRSNGEISTAIPFVRVENLNISWSKDCIQPWLKGISFTLGNGDLLAVTGPVGCGKTSLLMSILGDVKPSSGRIIKQGRITLAPQIPWIFSGTVRENILFGSSFDLKRYQKVVTACQLLSDLEDFPNGDLTLIGERGISLSGGQRTRISLARSVYYHADIYLLDDPFSALDIKVGKRLFEQCVKGLLKSCIVILVTHHRSYLKDINRILLMKEGSMVAEGSYHKVKEASIDEFNFEMLSPESRKEVSRSDSSYSKDVTIPVSAGVCKAEEKSMSGSIPLITYWQYFRTGNSVGSLLFLCILLITSQGKFLYLNHHNYKERSFTQKDSYFWFNLNKPRPKKRN